MVREEVSDLLLVFGREKSFEVGLGKFGLESVSRESEQKKLALKRSKVRGDVR